jgi:hypothetical protein
VKATPRAGAAGCAGLRGRKAGASRGAASSGAQLSSDRFLQGPANASGHPHQRRSHRAGGRTIRRSAQIRREIRVIDAANLARWPAERGSGHRSRSEGTRSSIEASRPSRDLLLVRLGLEGVQDARYPECAVGLAPIRWQLWAYLRIARSLGLCQHSRQRRVSCAPGGRNDSVTGRR